MSDSTIKFEPATLPTPESVVAEKSAAAVLDYVVHEKTGAMFSPEDADLLETNWYLDSNRYAARWSSVKPQRRAAHREVISRMIGRELVGTEQCDHINRNRLDNRRGNLRVVSNAQNAQNRSIYRTNSTGFRNVSKDRVLSFGQSYRAVVTFNDKQFTSRGFRTAKDASIAAEKIRRELGFIDSN